MLPDPAYLTTMGDGTIKQINPFSGTRVWTVPGRNGRPQSQNDSDSKPVSDTDWTHGCTFCSARYMETPPEKARVVYDKGWKILERLTADQLFNTTAEFRVVPNLFEIVSYNYWHENYGYEMPAEIQEFKQQYLSTEQGRRHVRAVQAAKLRLSGKSPEEIANLENEDFLAQADAFFGGGHDVVIARRHWLDGATSTTELASAGSLTPDEHEQFIRLTLHSMKNLYDINRYVRYVAVFQNWLKPAGSSFDHLHKQLVSIDEHGADADQGVSRLRENPNFFNECTVNYANYHNLLIAENDSAIAFAGFGHRWPTIEIYSKSPKVYPWEHDDSEVRDMSDLLHAIHAGTGVDVPTNEEWHNVPIDLDVPMPWRINIKWRISTIAGFEGDTKIFINTMSPYDIRASVTDRMRELRKQGKIADLRIGSECSGAPNPLKYNPSLW